MKCNYKKHLKRSEDCYAVTPETAKRIWEIQTLLTLRRDFGFGEKRLKQFVECLQRNYNDFMERAAITDKYDKKGRELTNIDAALIRDIRELRQCGIDHRELLGGGTLAVVDGHGKMVNLDDVVDKIL